MSDFRLKVFLSVARNMSFTKASEELHITQPAISRHIKELEEQYHTPLFNREGLSISLTKGGELLLSHSKRIIDEYQLMEFEMNQLNKTFSGELNIGASTTISQYVIPSLIAMYIKRYPDIKINLLSGNSREIEESLHSHKIDLGFVEGEHIDSTLFYEDYIKDEIVLVANCNGKYKDVEEITLDQLSTQPLVLREQGSGTLEVIGNKLNSKGYKLQSLNIILHLGSTESIKNFIQQTDCLSLVSIRSISKEVFSGLFKIIDIEEFSIERKFRFVSRRGPLTPISETFLNFAISNSKVI